MLKKAAIVFLICASTIISVGCVTNSTSYLYAALSQSDQIVAYREDPNSGILTQLATSPVTAGPGVHALAVHPSKKYLYAANSGENDVSRFVIAADGSLTEQTPRQEVGTAPTLLAIDSTGSYLCVGNSGSANVELFLISSSDGSLSLVGTFPTGLSPLNMALSPTGNFLYVTLSSTQAGAPGSIEVIGINPSAAAPTSAFTFIQLTNAGASPYGLAITPNGSFLYTGNFTDNTISEFSIGSDGSLTLLAGSPVGQSSTYSNPVALLVDNSGKYLFAANEQSSGNLSGYAISSSGGLAILGTSPFPTSAQPNSLAIDPAGKHVFVGNQASSSKIQAFSLDPGSGNLSVVTSYGVGAVPTSLVMVQ